MTSTDTPRILHEGRNLKRIREMLQVKQTTLASELGGDWNQKKISQLEDKDVIAPEILEEVAKALRVTPETIKNFDEEAAINIISNTFSDFKDNAIASAMNYQCSFNPIDKVVKLYDEKVALLERLVQGEKEKVEILKKMLREST